MTVAERITAYLSGGGLFNPELANHDAVRDLLMDARDALVKPAFDIDEAMRLADEYVAMRSIAAGSRHARARLEAYLKAHK